MATLHRRRIGQYGFTLMELLVVIAIIALLAAILFPVFARAREKARQTACASNLKQLGLAILQYTQDYDEHMPRGRYGDACCTGYYYENWSFSIYPYVKSSGIFTCPDDPTKPTTYNVLANSNPVPMSYAFNVDAIATHYGYPPNYPPASMAVYNAPALTIWLAESAGDFNDPASYITANSNEPGAVFVPGSPTPNEGDDYLVTGPLGAHGAPTNPEGSTPFPNGVHSDGSNFLLADGHVKWMKGSQISTGMESQCANPANTYQDQSGCIGYGSFPTYTGAAGTGNMTDGHGTTFLATMSKY